MANNVPTPSDIDPERAEESYTLGLAHLNGDGVPQNPELALRHLREAAMLQQPTWWRNASTFVQP